jgi:hypothetical protein
LEGKTIMAKYKSKDGKPYDSPLNAVIARDDLDPISQEEFDALVIEINTPPPPTPLTLEQKKATANVAISAWRAAQERGGIVFSGKVFDTDTASRERILSVVLSGANPLGMWTTASNDDVTMPFNRMVDLQTAIVSAGAEIHGRQRAMKGYIRTATEAQVDVFVPRWVSTPTWLPETLLEGE